MLMRLKNYNLKMAMIIQIMIALALLLWISVTVGNGQTPDGMQNAEVKNEPAQTVKENPAPAVLQPVFTEYKSVKIGMTDDDLRSVLGKADKTDDAGLYYKFSGAESAQIVLDADKKVRVISVTYAGEKDGAPKITDVFGADAKVEAKPDGSIYHLVEYPQAGYWIAYYRAAGDNPMVIVTMQKM